MDIDSRTGNRLYPGDPDYNSIIDWEEENSREENSDIEIIV